MKPIKFSKPGDVKAVRDFRDDLVRQKQEVDRKLGVNTTQILNANDVIKKLEPPAGFSEEEWAMIMNSKADATTQEAQQVEPDPIVVRAQNVHDYFVQHAVDHGWNDLTTFKCARPPFPEMLITYDHEFSFHSEANGDALKNIVCSTNLLVLERTVEHFSHYLKPEDMPANVPFDLGLGRKELIAFVDKVRPTCFVELQIKLFNQGRSTTMPGRWFVALNEHGAVLNNDATNVAWIFIQSPEEFNRYEKELSVSDPRQSVNEVQHMFSRHGAIALATIQFMNCRNVEVLDNPPSRQQRRHAERHNEKPPMTYKTLRIIPDSHHRTTVGNMVQNPGSAPLHICRGHFKDFRQGPGLGKYHIRGMWWWHPAVRGNSARGVVQKDYEVIANVAEKKPVKEDDAPEFFGS